MPRHDLPFHVAPTDPMSPDGLAPAAAKSSSNSFARSAGLVIAFVLLFTLAVSLVLALIPELAVLGLLAYCFGCRHGVDAVHARARMHFAHTIFAKLPRASCQDHIAAIDNVTRRLAGTAGRRTMLIGVWFSLGHCTVVVIVCAAVIVGARTSSRQFEMLEDLGAAVGPWVAAVVLVTIGSMNLCAARELRLQWRQREARGHVHEIASLLTRGCPAL